MFSKLFNFINRNKVILLILLAVFCFSIIRYHQNFENFAKGTSVVGSGEIKNTKTFDLSLPDLKSQFGKMTNEAHWDVKKPLYWGYYFYDNDKERLKQFSLKLQKEGLKTYKIKESASSEGGSYLLYAYEYVVYTPESLFDRCNKLLGLAVANNIEEFDGWESGHEPL